MLWRTSPINAQNPKERRMMSMAMKTMTKSTRASTTAARAALQSRHVGALFVRGFAGLSFRAKKYVRSTNNARSTHETRFMPASALSHTSSQANNTPQQSPNKPPPLKTFVMTSSTTSAWSPNTISAGGRCGGPSCAGVVQVVRGFSSAAVEDEKSGLMSRLTDNMRKRVEAKKSGAKDQAWEEQMEMLLGYDSMGVGQFADFMIDTLSKAGADGWKSKLPFVRSQAGMEEAKRSIKILRLINERERTEESLSRFSRLRLAKAAGVSAEDVEQLAKQQEMIFIYHGWLRSRVERGLPLPEDQDHASLMMQRDAPKLTPRMKMKMQRQNKKTVYKMKQQAAKAMKK